MNQRLYYIDYVRLFLCCTVIFHHVAIGFGAAGGWYYFSPTRVEGISELLYSIQMGIDQSYFMSLFFFVSALFTPRSLDKKGVSAFLKDRFFRLAIPMLVYIFIIHPLLVWYIWGMGASYQFELGPLWFVFSLIFFELTYILVRKLNINLPKVCINSFSMSVFALVTGVAAFILRLFVDTRHATMGIIFANFVLYVAMYSMGIVASRQNLLETLSPRRAYKWLAIAFVTWIVMLGAASSHIEDTAGGCNVTSFVYSVWESVSCVAISYFLLTMGKTYLNRSHPFFEKVSADSFLAFVIHPFPVVWLTKLMENTAICPELLIPITSIMAIFVSFCIAHFIKVVSHKLHYRWV